MRCIWACGALRVWEFLVACMPAWTPMPHVAWDARNGQARARRSWMPCHAMPGPPFPPSLTQLADFLRVPLERAGGMMPLPDVYCMYNR